MRLTEYANNYTAERGLARLNLRYSAERFERLFGSTQVSEVTTAKLIDYRNACKLIPLAARTIESAIVDLQTLYTAATGNTLDAGPRLKIPRPVPQPASLTDISAAYDHSPDWIRQWLALAYWTCLRLTDCLTLQRALSAPWDVLRWTASKTGRNHSWPVPVWLQRHLVMSVIVPVGQESNHLQRVLRSGLRIACDAAGVDPFTPHQLRQRSLTEWARANAMAGGIVHGSGLGVLNHYVDPMTVLESAAPSVRLPESFCSDDERSDVDALPAIVAKLDPDAQDLVMRTATRLAK